MFVLKFNDMRTTGKQYGKGLSIIGRHMNKNGKSAEAIGKRTIPTKEVGLGSI